jgi:hypothetical protein
MVTPMHVTTGVRSGWIADRSKKLYRHTMEVEQMIERLLAEIRTNRGNESRPRTPEIRNDSRPRTPERFMLAKMEINQERMEAN